MNIYKVNTNICITLSFTEKDLVEKVKKIPNRKWNAKMLRWDIPINNTSLNYIRVFSDYYKYELPEDIKTLIIQVKNTCESNLSLSSSHNSDFKIREGLKIELRPFQVAGVEYLTNNKKTILGDEQGLGKTIQSIASIHHNNLYPCLIVCPKSVKLNWRNEFKKCLHEEKTIEILESNTKEISDNSDVYIINYDSTHKQVLPLKRIKFKCLILDESHLLKNSQTKRFTSINAISGKIPYIYELSGTMILSKPTELISQLRIINKLKEFGGSYYFKERYCNPTFNGFGTTYSGITNGKELHEKLRQTCYVRRNKKDVLTELPDKVRTVIPIEITNRKEYDLCEQNLRDYLKLEMMGENAHLSSKLLGLKNQIMNRKLEYGEQLVQLNKLRQLVIKGKLKNDIEWVEEFLENTNEKLVIFIFHTHTGEEISKHFNCGLIYGDTKTEERQRLIDDFQDNENTRLLCLNIKAGGVGITLTAASNVCFLELGWTPGELDQAEDRCHRMGQKNSVNVYYLLSNSTIDEKMFNLIESKRCITNIVNSGIESEQVQMESMLKQIINSYRN